MSKKLSREELQKLSGPEFFARYGEKLCKGCSTIKPYISFPPNSFSKDGRHSHCHKCYDDYIERRDTEYEVGNASHSDK